MILVHTQALLNQWKRSLSEFLEIDETLPELPKKRGRKKERSLIGQLGGSKNNLSGFVDIAIMQSLISGDEILVTSPYLHIAQVKWFLNLIPENVRVTVITSDESCFKPDAWEKTAKAIDLLEEKQVKVMLRQKVYQRYAVVDKNILWYGGINFLGFDKAAHGAMRLCSAELAKELMDRVDGEQETQLVLEGG